MERRNPPAEGAKKARSQCRSALVFNPRYPVLAVAMTLVREGPSSHDRIRYAQAWVCQNGGCDYREVVDDI